MAEKVENHLERARRKRETDSAAWTSLGGKGIFQVPEQTAKLEGLPVHTEKKSVENEPLLMYRERH